MPDPCCPRGNVPTRPPASAEPASSETSRAVLPKSAPPSTWLRHVGRSPARRGPLLRCGVRSDANQDVAGGNRFGQEEPVAVVAVIRPDCGVGDGAGGCGAHQLRHVEAQAPLVAQLLRRRRRPVLSRSSNTGSRRSCRRSVVDLRVGCRDASRAGDLRREVMLDDPVENRAHQLVALGLRQRMQVGERDFANCRVDFPSLDRFVVHARDDRGELARDWRSRRAWRPSSGFVSSAGGAAHAMVAARRAAPTCPP